MVWQEELRVHTVLLLLPRLLHFIKEFKHANLQHFIKTHTNKNDGEDNVRLQKWKEKSEKKVELELFENNSIEFFGI